MQEPNNTRFAYAIFWIIILENISCCVYGNGKIVAADTEEKKKKKFRKRKKIYTPKCEHNSNDDVVILVIVVIVVVVVVAQALTMDKSKDTNMQHTEIDKMQNKSQPQNRQRFKTHLNVFSTSFHFCVLHLYRKVRQNASALQCCHGLLCIYWLAGYTTDIKSKWNFYLCVHWALFFLLELEIGSEMYSSESHNWKLVVKLME